MVKKIMLKDIMNKDVITASPDDNVQKAAWKMKEHKIGMLVVTDKSRRILGIVTERDVINKVVSSGRDIIGTQVGDIMEKNVVTGSPDMTDLDAARIFSSKGVKKLPITVKGKICGIITQTDLLKIIPLKSEI